MAHGNAEKAAAGAAASFEAEIRANARPMLTGEERVAAASKKAALELRYAAARCREAAEAQLARAEEHEAAAAAIEKGA